MADLILVRHSSPQIDQSAPARFWRLSDEGRARCYPLANLLAPLRPALLAASVEPKASETASLLAGLLGCPVQHVEGLHEHERGLLPWLDKERFEATLAEFFRRPDALVFGKETADQAFARFTEAVGGVIKAHPGQTVAVVTHGTVMTLFASRAAGLDPFSLWKQLGIPSFIALSLPDLKLLGMVGQVAAAG